MVEMQYARAIIARNDAWIAWTTAADENSRLDAMYRYIQASNAILALQQACQTTQPDGSQS